MSLLGRVPFGRVSSSPPVVLAQMVHVYSVFMLLLGGSLLVLEVTGAVEQAFERLGVKDSDAAKGLTTHSGFFLSVGSLFVPKEVGVSATYGSAALKFALAHVIASLTASFPIAFCIQRRRFAADFVGTLYGAYIITSVVVARSLSPLGSLVYWGSLVVGAAATWFATTQICYRREMAEIRVDGAVDVPNAADLAVQSPA